MRFKKKFIIEAIEWRGDNESEMAAFAGEFFQVIRTGNEGDPTASVFDEVHDTWIKVWTSDWIVRGPRGEYYPINAGVLESTYDKVENNDGSGTQVQQG